MAVSAKVSNSPLDMRIITPGGVPRIVYMKEAASQSYNAGQLVYGSGSNQVTTCTASQAVGGSAPIAGIALLDATGTTNTSVPILVPDLNSEILIRCGTSGTAATAVEATWAIGDAFDIYIDASGYPTLDSGTESNEKLVVTGYVRDVNGDLTEWVTCRPCVTEPGMWLTLSESIS